MLDCAAMCGHRASVMKFLLLLVVVALAPAAFAQSMVNQSAFGGAQGVEGVVSAIAMQADGKILIGGTFSAVNGVPRGNLARLNSDGTLDRSFADTPVAGTNGPVRALAIREDGSIVVGGNFSQAGQVTINNIALYKPDGTVDRAFAQKGYPGTNGEVLALAEQSDGRIVLGGRFSAVCGHQRLGVARIDARGNLEEAVPASGELNGQVDALAPMRATAIAGGAFQVTNQPARSLYVLP
jgi:uncharacterized delta-60 repeat protein